MSGLKRPIPLSPQTTGDTGQICTESESEPLLHADQGSRFDAYLHLASAVRDHTGRQQGEIPLIALFSFAEPALMPDLPRSRRR